MQPVSVPHQVIGVAIVVWERQVLVGQRAADQALPGYFEFPGGKQLAHEPLEQTVARECLEETGLQISVGHSICYCQHHYEHAVVQLTFYDCRIRATNPPPRPPFRWVPIQQLDQFRFPPANAQVLQLLQARDQPGVAEFNGDEFPESL